MDGIARPLRDDIVAGLARIDAGEESFIQLAPVSRPEDLAGRSQALFFLKPELLYPDLDRTKTIDTVGDVLAAASISVGGVAVLGPDRLAQTIAAHYGMINRVSRFGTAALSEAATAKLQAEFGDQLSAGVPALGGHEVVERYGVTSEDLDAAFKAPTKLAPGTYAVATDVAGTPLIVLNGFHPAQLGHYTAPRSRVVALEIHWSDRTWASFRTDVVGATRPEQAVAHSVRGVLLARSAELGIGEVAVSTNGVHGSAGPVEAMVEIARFLEVDPAQTVLGAALLTAGVPTTMIEQLTASGDAGGDLRQKVFDATEEVEPAAAVEYVSRL
ncbi:MAG: hypothetical protein IRY85_16195 [Micromonosporaceae bacterium]|nr:hypothetical protein [Micromonosporaceae bacterium]